MLYEATGDEAVLARLQELVSLFTSTFITKQNLVYGEGEHVCVYAR